MNLTQNAAVCVAALLLDRLLGEPHRLHPLVGFGRMAGAIETHLNRPVLAPYWRRFLGLVAVVSLVLPLALLCWLAGRIPVLGVLTSTALLYLTLGARSLAEHARRVQAALDENDLALARRRVGFMVSRDTATLQSDDVARAAVESVLENGNDAVFGALFWFLVAGAGGAVAYRLSNTLDAMWGYRTSRYLHYGWAAARLDDLLNLVPARLTALTYVLLGCVRPALRCWRTQARHWESPNAGPVMAAGAAALGLELGGPAIYHGIYHQRPVLGEGAPATSRDIERALRLVRRGVVLWLSISVIAVLGRLHFG